VLSLPPGSFQLMPAVKPDVVDVRVATYAADARVHVVLLTISGGLTVIEKR
jgi:hypothetical protein